MGNRKENRKKNKIKNGYLKKKVLILLDISMSERRINYRGYNQDFTGAVRRIRNKINKIRNKRAFNGNPIFGVKKV